MSPDYPNGSRASLTALLITQTLLAFAANAGQILVFAVLLAPGAWPAMAPAGTLGFLAALLAAPYLGLSPLLAWLTDRFSSRAMLHIGILLQLVLLGGLALGFHQRSVALVLGAFLLLAVQTALVSPAKRAMLREVSPERKFNPSVLLLEMLTVTAVVVGAYAGVVGLDGEVRGPGPEGLWAAATRVAFGLTAVSGLAWLTFLPAARTAARVAEPLPQELLTRQINHLIELFRSSRLRNTALGILFFYLFGGMLVLLLIETAGQGGAAALAVTLLLFCGIGALGGSFVAGLLARGRMELGLVPFGALGMALGAGLAARAPMDAVEFRVALVLLGCSAGLFLAPLHVYFQNRVTPERRTRMLGALNLFRGLGGVAAGGGYYLTTVTFQWTAQEQLRSLALLATVVAAIAVWVSPEHLMVLLFRAVGRVLYRMRIEGLENLPKGGALVISNHISYVDALILQVVFPRKLWFLAVHGPRRRGVLLWFYRVSGVIPLSSAKATEGLRLAIRKIKEGELVCVFPEGQVSRTGALMEIRKGFEVLAKRAGAPVVPVFIDSLWGSIFSYSNQKFFWKLPEEIPFSVLVKVGPPLPSPTVNAVLARQALLDLGEQAYQQRRELRRHLGREVLRSLARHPWKSVIVDRTAERRAMTAGMLLAVAASYAQWIRRTVPERRVGIVLPPGIGGYIANVAVVLAGKVPVNLNFTAGAPAIVASLRLGEVATVISAEAVRTKLPDFPWPEKTRDLRADIAALGKPAILARLAMVWLLPARLLSAVWRVPAAGDHAEAALLFTSGSSGEPKGVPLTHRNLLANCGQIYATGILPRRETLLSCLPIFHSFGFTVMMWYALLRGLRIVTLPTPLDAKRNVDVIEEEKVTVFVSTPAFIRPVVKRAEPHQLRSLRFLFSGADRLPIDLYEACLQKFGLHIYQGYGLTETTPVSNVNLVDPPRLPHGARPQEGHRLGSTGRMVAGLTARIVHPETGAVLAPNATGIICFKGPNVFGGYLNDPERTARTIRDGWFHTGDLGRFDEDGFLFIEGRLSRFSKVGGEMVPHLTIEQKIVEAFGLEAGEAPKVIVLGVPDAAKGEALVLLTTEAIDAAALREKLTALGLPNLWIPKTVRRLASIPMLGSGKCDMKGCQTLALGGAAAAVNGR